MDIYSVGLLDVRVEEERWGGGGVGNPVEKY